MDLKLVNPQAKYAKVTLIDPPPLGYIHLAAAVDPPSGPTAIPGKSPRKAALLIRLRSLARQLETLTTVERATIYRAILIAPPAGFTKAGTHVARYDVVALIETTSPAVLGEVDKTRQGLFLFNYFVADDAAVALQLWEHLAGWYAVETGLDNSTLLEPLGDADYVFVNHARWDDSLPRFLFRQLTKPSFRTYLLANLQANRTRAMPILYRLASPPPPEARSR